MEQRKMMRTDLRGVKFYSSCRTKGLFLLLLLLLISIQEQPSALLTGVVVPTGRGLLQRQQWIAGELSLKKTKHDDSDDDIMMVNKNGTKRSSRFVSKTLAFAQRMISNKKISKKEEGSTTKILQLSQLLDKVIFESDAASAQLILNRLDVVSRQGRRDNTRASNPKTETYNALNRIIQQIDGTRPRLCWLGKITTAKSLKTAMTARFSKDPKVIAFRQILDQRTATTANNYFSTVDQGDATDTEIAITRRRDAFISILRDIAVGRSLLSKRSTLLPRMSPPQLNENKKEAMKSTTTDTDIDYENMSLEDRLDRALQSDPRAAQSILVQLDKLLAKGAQREMLKIVSDLVKYVDDPSRDSNHKEKLSFWTRFRPTAFRPKTPRCSKSASIASLRRILDRNLGEVTTQSYTVMRTRRKRFVLALKVLARGQQSKISSSTLMTASKSRSEVSAIARIEELIISATDRKAASTFELLDMALRSDPLAAQSILDQLDDFRKTGAWQEMVEFTDKLVQYIDGRRQGSSPLLKWYNVRFATRFSKRARIASLQRVLNNTSTYEPSNDKAMRKRREALVYALKALTRESEDKKGSTAIARLEKSNMAKQESIIRRRKQEILAARKLEMEARRAKAMAEEAAKLKNAKAKLKIQAAVEGAQELIS